MDSLLFSSDALTRRRIGLRSTALAFAVLRLTLGLLLRERARASSGSDVFSPSSEIGSDIGK